MPPPSPRPTHLVPPAPRRGRLDGIPRRRLLLFALLLLLLPAALLALGWFRCGIRGCPDVARLGAFRPDGAPLVVDRYGKRVGELKLADRRTVALQDLPPFVADAFIAIEDQRFREHHGVDLKRVGGAMLANLRAGGIREGSSTITMQVARNLFPERIPGQQQTMSRKLLEMRVAGEIERAYSKDEILELYLNNIYFGGGTRGIEAASQYYFRHPASKLTLREAALLAALPKAPTHYDPRKYPKKARERRDLVLTRMADQERITQKEAEAAKRATLGVVRRGRKLAPEDKVAGWFLEEVRTELEELFGDSFYRQRVRVVTTLDVRAQTAAENELEAQLRRIERGAWGRFSGQRYAEGLDIDDDGTPYLQGAVVFLEAESGDVLAWVGGRDFRQSKFDRVNQASRQIGSLVKPFVYAEALARGIQPSRLISDQPLVMRLSGGQEWKPRNFEDDYRPAVSLRDALVQSRNAATVRLASEVGFGRVRELAESAGLPRMPDLPSIALGAAPASPLQMARAYTAFANLGTEVRPRMVLRVEDEKGETLWEADEPATHELLDPAVSYLLTDLLRDAVRRGTGGPASAVGLPVPAAGKTGTTNDGNDVWFVGYTPDVVGAVWIGFDHPQAIVPHAQGGRLAAPVWGRIVRSLYGHRRKVGGWPRPSGIEEHMVDADTYQPLADGCPPSHGRAYRELFLAGTVPPLTCAGSEQGWWGRLRGWWESDSAEGAQPPLEEATPAYEESPYELGVEPEGQPIPTVSPGPSVFFPEGQEGTAEESLEEATPRQGEPIDALQPPPAPEARPLPTLRPRPQPPRVLAPVPPAEPTAEPPTEPTLEPAPEPTEEPPAEEETPPPAIAAPADEGAAEPEPSGTPPGGGAGWSAAA